MSCPLSSPAALNEIKFSVGSNLLLSVVDAAGNSGGQPPNLFSVGGQCKLRAYIIWMLIPGAAGSTTSCLPPPPSENVTVVPNITKTVTTCQAMGFQIVGGTKPYNLTLVAPVSLDRGRNYSSVNKSMKEFDTHYECLHGPNRGHIHVHRPC